MRNKVLRAVKSLDAHQVAELAASQLQRTSHPLWLWIQLGLSYSPASLLLRHVNHLFNSRQVSCPNYLFEILGWIVICVLTGHWSGESLPA
jgi:hypothetical protein